MAHFIEGKHDGLDGTLIIKAHDYTGALTWNEETPVYTILTTDKDGKTIEVILELDQWAKLSELTHADKQTVQVKLTRMVPVGNWNAFDIGEISSE